MNTIHRSRKLIRQGGMVVAGLALVALCFLTGQPPPAQASLFWASANGITDLTSGVRSSTPSLCFVGDAVTSRLPRVVQIIQYLKEFENVSSIRFVSPTSSQPLSEELADGHLDMLTCPPPIWLAGMDWFYGDMRMVIPGTSVGFSDPVPGNGCTAENSGGGSWSSPPWSLDLPASRACLFNLKLGDNPWCPVAGEFWPCASNPEIVPYLDHTLHEVGHALGLAHEHARADANVTGCGPDYGGSIINGYITPYDRDSVMHYMFESCGIPGNYDYSGLSYYDRVAVHILYPPAGLPAEIVGNLKIQQGQTLQLGSAWKAWGANISFVASNFVWRMEGFVVAYTPDLSLGPLGAGTYTVTFEHDDFLGRHHTGSWTVEVLTAQEYTTSVVEGAALAPLYLPIYTELIPVITR